MEEKKYKAVLTGCLDNLPTLNSKLVRIFISSTFTDTREERNLLLEDVYPKLKTYCKEKHGMDFQLVDMRWGVPQEASNDHLASQLCMEEIKNCQKLSTGPNFVTFLNQKHGFRPLQVSIPEAEFTHLTESLTEFGRDPSLISQWYLKDENQSPPIYVLQPISSLIPGYVDKNNKEAAREWDQVFESIKEDFKFASKICFERGHLTEEEKHKYFMSVTEDEIYNGLLRLPENAVDHCMCFVRIIEDITQHLEHEKAYRFIDLVQPKTVDEEAQTILSHLRDEKVISKLQNFNVTRNVVKWSKEDGINKKDHQDYLDKFKQSFYSSTVAMVNRAVQRESLLIQDNLYIEVLQHLTMTSERCAVFHGREEILAGITDYLKAQVGQPLVLGGVSGSGKTSIMARTAKLAYEMGKQKSVVVVRFLGTSPDSSNLWRLLLSICQQVSVCYNKDRDKIPDDNIEDLKIYFRELLKCATKDKPLVILLDSLDQLSRENGAHKLTWLPRRLPEHVHLIVSVYTEAVDLTRILHVIFGKDSFINVPVFSAGLSKVVVKSWLAMKGRTLTNDQFAIVEKVFKLCSLPLFVKLTFDQVIKWRSYTPLIDCQLAETVQDTIDMLFAQLEKKHGKIFVFRTLAYVTASKSGISETELEDLLSLDDVVLTNIFQIHVPPLRRIPPLLLVRLRHDLKEYLVDKEVDGVRSFFWYHRQFLETAKKRYLSESEFVKEIHSLMADYYIGKWYGVKKPFKYTPEQMKRVGVTSPEGEEDRKISAQPLVYAEESKGKKTLFNKRKLRKLPLHLFKALRQSELRSICLFNYRWIQTKLHAMLVMDLLLDYTMCGEKNSILYKILKASQSTLKKFPNSLSMEISGRLLAKLQTKTDSDEMKLLEESLKAAEKDCKLVPYQPCFLIPKESQMYIIEHPRVPVDCRLMEVSGDSKRIAMLSNSNEVLIWDLESGEMETTVKLSTKNEESLNVMIKPEGKDFLIIGTSLQKVSNPVFVVDINSGTIEHALQLEKTYPTMGFKDDLKFLLTKKYLGVNVIKQAADIFDIDTGKLVHEFDGKPDQMKIIANDTLVILHPKQENSYIIYSLDTFETVKEIQLNQCPKFLQLSNDLNLGCIAFDKSAEIQIICLESGKKLGSTKATVIADKDPSMKIQAVTIFEDQCLITTMKGFVVHNIKTNKQKEFAIPKEVKPQNVKVLSFDGFLTRDGSTLFAGYENYFVVWDAKTAKILRCMEASRGRFSKIILSPSGEFIVNTSMKNNSIVTWNVSSMRIKTSNFEPLSLKNSVRYLATDRKGTIAIVRSSSSQEFAVIDVQLGVIRCHISEEYECMRPAVSTDGKYSVLREYASETCLNVWETSSGSLVKRIPVSSLELKGYILGTKSKNMAMLIEDENSAEHFLKMCTLPNGEVNAQIPLKKYNMMDIFYAKNDEYCIVGVEEQLYPGVKIYARSYRVSDGTLMKEYENIHPQRIQLLTPESGHFVGQRIHTDPQGKQSWELVVLNIETGEATVIKGEAPVTALYFGAFGRFGVDRDRTVYDLKEKKRSFQFDIEGDYSQITEIRGAQQPKITSDERYCVWINFGHNLLKMGQISSQALVSVCPIHSIPMNISVTPQNILLIGCEDGRIMMLQLLTDQESDSHSVFKTIFNRSMKKTVQARDSLLKSIDAGVRKSQEIKRGSAKTSKTCTMC